MAQMVGVTMMLTSVQYIRPFMIVISMVVSSLDVGSLVYYLGDGNVSSIALIVMSAHVHAVLCLAQLMHHEAKGGIVIEQVRVLCDSSHAYRAGLRFVAGTLHLGGLSIALDCQLPSVSHVPLLRW
jgi:hypothetical protein